MEIANLEHYYFGECVNCKKLFISEKEPHDAILELTDMYEQHLLNTPKCKEWHDTLPTFNDIRGILSEA